MPFKRQYEVEIIEINFSKFVEIFIYRICSLMGELCQCDYRVRLGDNSQWYPLSRLARNRVIDLL